MLQCVFSRLFGHHAATMPGRPLRSWSVFRTAPTGSCISRLRGIDEGWGEVRQFPERGDGEGSGSLAPVGARGRFDWTPLWVAQAESQLGHETFLRFCELFDGGSYFYHVVETEMEL